MAVNSSAKNIKRQVADARLGAARPFPTGLNVYRSLIFREN